MWKPIGAGLALAGLCGCFKTKDELTLETDGSGSVRIETRTSLPCTSNTFAETRSVAGKRKLPAVSNSSFTRAVASGSFSTRSKNASEVRGSPKA